MVECERVVVWSFEGTHCVSSYRVPQPSSHFLAQLERELSSEFLQTPWTVALSVKRMRSQVDQRKKERQERGEREGERGGGVGVSHAPKESDGKLNKQEARRLRREQRKKEVNE